MAKSKPPTRWQIRVTRDLDGDTVDIDIEADTFDHAKVLAVNEAIENQDRYFSDLPEPRFSVAPMDDDEDMCRVED